jgi:hypothetical protein
MSLIALPREHLVLEEEQQMCVAKSRILDHA